jgi:hypothetical protein
MAKVFDRQLVTPYSASRCFSDNFSSQRPIKFAKLVKIFETKVEFILLLAEKFSISWSILA